MDGLGHLVEVGAFFEGVSAVGIDAVRTLHSVGNCESHNDISRADSAPSANTAPYQSKNFAARSGLFLPIS